MNLRDISSGRLVSQQIAGTSFRTPKDLVGHLGAMQAQDFDMAVWAIGMRLPGSTKNEIVEAFNRGDFLRTHVLRPTWHFVSADDIHGMLELSAPRIKASLKTRHKELGITEDSIAKSKSIMTRALSDGKHLTRDELIIELAGAGISCNGSQAYHYLMLLELDGILCSGAINGKKQTYALLAERASRRKSPSRSEAPAKLARKYFSSHGPATLPDFIWWSGLPTGEAKEALEASRTDLVSVTTGGQVYWFSHSVSSPPVPKKSVHLLPAFDEFIISYKDRSPAISLDKQRRAVSNNGVFRPVVVVDGQVAGLWKKAMKKDGVVVHIKPFQAQSRRRKALIENEIAAYGLFLGRKIEALWEA
jgi:hypothetical protein